jgi:predicted ATP-grasp superfamily ATP-dependent carboligase
MRHDPQNRPSAFVIGSNDTAISTAWCLADAGIPARLFAVDRDGIARYSRRVPVTDLADLDGDGAAICDAIANMARAERVKPVLLSCGDPESLMLAGHRYILDPVCVLSSLSREDLLAIVSKDRLYAAAERAGVETPPSIVAPSPVELEKWMLSHPPPYLAKPFFLGDASSVLRQKNRCYESAEELAGFVAELGSSSLIVQSLVRGGDGWVFDCYGFCDRRGKVVAMASHRRLRQQPANRGVSSYGEIPSRSVPGSEESVFALTERLLSAVRYHGIFGIEWVKDLGKGRYYLLDFNARPFLTIRHLKDCGLNLPAIAYEEMRGGDVSAVTRKPGLKHRYWLDLAADLRSFRHHRNAKEITPSAWLSSLFAARSFAVCSIRDPMPTLVRAWQTFSTVLAYLRKKMD